MSKCNWFHRMLVSVFHIPGTDPQVIADTNKLIRDIRAETNRLLREKELQIIHLKQELEKFTSRTYVWVDPSIYHAPFPTAAYDAPSPTTDGKMRAERMDNAQFIEQIHTQHIVPAVVSPLRKSKLARLIHDAAAIPGLTAPEDDWLTDGIDKTARHQATKP